MKSFRDFLTEAEKPYSDKKAFDMFTNGHCRSFAHALQQHIGGDIKSLHKNGVEYHTFVRKDGKNYDVGGQRGHASMILGMDGSLEKAHQWSVHDGSSLKVKPKMVDNAHKYILANKKKFGIKNINEAFLSEAKVKMLYHSTPHDFHPSEIRPWSHFGDKNTSKDIAQAAKNMPGTDYKPHVLHQYEHSPSGKELKMDSDYFGQHPYHTDHQIVLDHLHSHGLISKEHYESHFDQGHVEYPRHPFEKGEDLVDETKFRKRKPDFDKRVDKTIKNLGYSHVSYPNMFEAAGQRGGTRSHIVIDPADLRHVKTTKIKVQDYG